MSLYKEIISRFPRKGLAYSFAYGSGVKRQLGYDIVEKQKNNIIDLIFCVENAQEWHKQNLEKHTNHYSGIQVLGSKFITGYQENLGAGVYFNTLVPLADIGVTIKYGVVSEKKLLDDLLDWRYLYLAGRLQKPVTHVIPPNRKLAEALNKNLLNAFQVALVLLPEHFTDFELFHTISALSYKGDFRMIFGENKHKVANIVRAQQKDFFELYRPAMKMLTKYVAADFSAKELGANRPVIQFEQDKSVAAIEFHLRNAPQKLRTQLTKNTAFQGSYAEIVDHIAGIPNLSKIVQVSVNDIVWRSSITQSLKNILTAGLVKSMVYSYRKAKKTFTK